MRTPKEFSDNLKKGIITDEMLEVALFSVNKRAKNWRDQKRKYRHMRWDIYDNYEKAEAEEKKMYQRKDELLSVVTPICVHKEFAGYDTVRIESYRNDYHDIKVREIFNGSIVKEGSRRERYGDWDYGHEYDYYEEEVDYIDYFDYEDRDAPNYRYYLYYIVGEHGFHTPITKEQAETLDIPCFIIDTLNTEGHDTSDLASVQFVNKVIDLIHTDKYELRGSISDPAHINTLRSLEEDKELETRKNLLSGFEQKSKNEISGNWEYLNYQIDQYMIKSTTINPYQLTDIEKSELEEEIKRKMVEALDVLDFGTVCKIKKKRKAVLKQFRTARFCHDVNMQMAKDLRLKDAVIDKFQNDSNVTVQKLYAFYTEVAKDKYMELYAEKTKETAEHTYIKNNVEHWRDEVVRAYKPAA